MQRRKALVVGINDYPERPLRNCNNDAEEIAGMLGMSEYGFEVTTLLNEKATRRTLISELKALFSSDSDFIIFYFAGHGITDDVDTYLVPIDTDSVDVGIDLDHLKRLINGNLAQKKTVAILLDCCHSGAATVRGLAGSNTRYITNSDIDRAIPIQGNSKVLFAACQPHELAYEEPSLQHGVFTYYLLEGMYGDAADAEGKITVPNLYEYVSRRFEKATLQTPVFKGDIVGRIILGENLSPRDRQDIPADKIRETELTAQNLMNQYIQSISTDIETWKSSTYKEACLILLPKLKWFERQITQFPQLRSQPHFNAAYSTAQSKLADLGHLMEGLNTRVGVVEEKIGSGTFGTVWHITSEHGGDLAYKVYHPMDLDNPEKLARFNRGYRAMEQLDHPHVVKVFEFTDCPIGFVMDYIGGPNLRNFVSWNREPVDIIRQLLTVGETLKHAHSRGVIHRDVKPENIIMRLDPATQLYRPYLTDFDLAWFSTATQFTREGFGSLIYAAPEQLAKPNSSVAHQATTDIYAFGQLCFFFACKRDPVPLLSDNTYALREELRSWQIEEPVRKMVELYERCTRQNPGDRIQDFRDICDQLFEVSQLLSQSDHKKYIGFAGFARQLSFSIVGSSPELIASDTEFSTTSRQTKITIEVQDNKAFSTEVRFRLESQLSLYVDGANNFEEARRVLNQRIDTLLRQQYPQAHRRAGQHGPYQIELHVKDITINIDGVEVCRQILTRVIDCIERS